MEDQNSDSAGAAPSVSEALTVAEAARVLGVSTQRVSQLLKEGVLPAQTVGRRQRISVTEVLAYKLKRNRERRETLNRLTKVEAAEGLYDLERPTEPAG